MVSWSPAVAPPKPAPTSVTAEVAVADCIAATKKQIENLISVDFDIHALPAATFPILAWTPAAIDPATTPVELNKFFLF